MTYDDDGCDGCDGCEEEAGSRETGMRNEEELKSTEGLTDDDEQRRAREALERKAGPIVARDPF